MLMVMENHPSIHDGRRMAPEDKVPIGGSKQLDQWD